MYRNAISLSSETDTISFRLLFLYLVCMCLTDIQK